MASVSSYVATAGTTSTLKVGGAGAPLARFTGNDVVLMAVPEPNAAALLGGLGVLALLRRRRD